MDYNYFIENENSRLRLDDYQISSGLLYFGTDFLINTNWNGSLFKGLFLVEGFDAIIEEGERDICSDDFLNGFQFDFNSEFVAFSMYRLDKEHYYYIGLESPVLWGFYSKIKMFKKPITAFYADLVKNYNFGNFLSSMNIEGAVGWRNEISDVNFGYFHRSSSFSEQTAEPGSIRLNFDCSSIYGFNSVFRLNPDLFDFRISFQQSEYNTLISGTLNDLQILVVENQISPDNFFIIEHRRVLSDLHLLEGKLKFSGFYEHYYVPEKTYNRGYIDAVPLSPVGVLYRRKDILEKIGFFFQQAGGSIGGTGRIRGIEIDGNLNISYLYLFFAGDYHYIDGIMTLFPFPHWGNPSVNNEKKIKEILEYLTLEPVITARIPMGNFTSQVTIGQLIPFNLSRDLSTSDSKLWGGFRASVLISFRL